jgi:Ni/Fe-hydrogenase subunit HybB-like protein
MNRVQNTKTVLWTITGLAAAVAVTRFIFGLGATTNLTDATPWGLWIGFDVMAGVALAGGGFVMTAIFYVFKRDQFHPLVKPAVLTAFLGYLAVIFGLLFDLGLPWNIWHMIIYWNPHSPLFEVGWCVMLYTAVLLLEFSPVPLEETSRYGRVRSFLLKFRFPLVLLGIMLSTLHQSSLGSLALLWPFKLHPLWYSAIIPVQFFISAVALGLMMVSLESLVSHWLYRRKPENDLVAGLARGAVWVLAIYLVIKLGDIIASGEFGLIFDGTWESCLFVFELLISTIIPLVLFFIPRVRRSAGGQWTGSAMVVIGMVLNRINVGGLMQVSATGDVYLPSWMEIVISMGVVSTAALAFLFAVEKLHIWEERPSHPESDPVQAPQFDFSSRVWLGEPLVAARTKYSVAFILAFAAGFALMPETRIESRGVEQVEALKARGGDTLYIDGNRDSYGAVFDHARHVDSLGQDKSCASCHHMNAPMDKQTGCWECHRSMYTESAAFDHDWHSSPTGGNIKCGLCHTPGLERTKTSARQCQDCHADLTVEGAKVAVDAYVAPSYVDAMHDLCLKCHLERAQQDSTRQAMALCPACHVAPPVDYIKPEMRSSLPTRDTHPVVFPAPSLKKEESPR